MSVRPDDKTRALAEATRLQKENAELRHERDAARDRAVEWYRAFIEELFACIYCGAPLPKDSANGPCPRGCPGPEAVRIQLANALERLSNLQTEFMVEKRGLVRCEPHPNASGWVLVAGKDDWVAEVQTEGEALALSNALNGKPGVPPRVRALTEELRRVEEVARVRGVQLTAVERLQQAATGEGPYKAVGAVEGYWAVEDAHGEAVAESLSETEAHVFAKVLNLPLDGTLGDQVTAKQAWEEGYRCCADDLGATAPDKIEGNPYDEEAP